jgi:hypothetical protein
MRIFGDDKYSGEKEINMDLEIEEIDLIDLRCMMLYVINAVEIVKYHLDHLMTNQYTVVIVSKRWEMEIQTEEEVEEEEIATEMIEGDQTGKRCLQLFVMIVVKSVKFLLNLQVTNQYTAVSV